MLDTLENVKGRLGIETDSYDEFLTQQINLISDTIEEYCDRKFNEADYIQTFYEEDMTYTKRFKLHHFPVSEIASITEDDVAVDEADYRLNNKTGFVTGVRRAFFNGPRVTEVTFTAGYPEGEIPSPIIAVLDTLVQQRYSRKTSGIELDFGSDVQRVSIPGTIAIDFDYSLKNNDRESAFGTILGNNQNILDKYRSERAVIGTVRLAYVEEDAP